MYFYKTWIISFKFKMNYSFGKTLERRDVLVRSTDIIDFL